MWGREKSSVDYESFISGADTFGQLGYENTLNVGDTPGEMPSPDVNVGGNVTYIALGYAHTCAILSNASMRCWGISI